MASLGATASPAAANEDFCVRASYDWEFFNYIKTGYDEARCADVPLATGICGYIPHPNPEVIWWEGSYVVCVGSITP